MTVDLSHLRTGTENETLVVLPTYNERENLPRIVEAVLSLGPEWRALVVDDQSPDGTGDVAEALGRREPRLAVLRRPGPRGLGRSYRDGLSLALAAGFDFVCTMDSDFSHDPLQLPELRRLAKEGGAALGSRYVEGGGVEEGWGLLRKLNSRTANLVARFALGLRVRDASAGFRCFRRDALAAIQPETLSAAGFSIMQELSHRVERAGFRWAEWPIRFAVRQKGRSKVSPRQVVDVLKMIWRLRVRAWRPR
ncbi:MAG TPA: polyprenol monophosphomannose synthase [Candidatus Brocadiia bacterium]|nr:polyprenol monophosphomannose synthase [Candidatus Brocadiia bacterium]